MKAMDQALVLKSTRENQMLTFLYIVLGKLMLLTTLKSQTLTLRQRERGVSGRRGLQLRDVPRSEGRPVHGFS